MLCCPAEPSVFPGELVACAATGRIAVFDASPSDCGLLHQTLKLLGVAHAMQLFQTEYEAIRYTEDVNAGFAAPPHVIIMDIHLPAGCGLDVLRAVRRSRRLADVEIFVFSTYVSPPTLALIRRLDKTRFIEKPFLIDEFVDVGRAVKDVLERAVV